MGAHDMRGGIACKREKRRCGNYRATMRLCICVVAMQLARWKLKEILEEKQLTQSDLGTRYRVSQSRISHYLDGEPIPAGVVALIDDDYARIFGEDANSANPLPARMLRRLRAVPPEKLHLVLVVIDAILSSKP